MISQAIIKTLEIYEAASTTEDNFKYRLKRYKIYHERCKFEQEKVLMERETFNHFCLINDNFFIEPENINYYLEKNFILHHYAGEKTNLPEKMKQILLEHYKVLLNRDFERARDSINNNPILKQCLVSLYVDSIHKKQNLTTNISINKPYKLREVASLLVDLDANRHGFNRPIHNITKEEINKPYTYEYTKKVSC